VGGGSNFSAYYAAQAALLAKSAERVAVDLGFELVQNGNAGTIIHDRKHRSWKTDSEWDKIRSFIQKLFSVCSDPRHLHPCPADFSSRLGTSFPSG
jgi:hypothetical protein